MICGSDTRRKAQESAPARKMCELGRYLVFRCVRPGCKTFCYQNINMIFM